MSAEKSVIPSTGFPNAPKDRCTQGDLHVEDLVLVKEPVGPLRDLEDQFPGRSPRVSLNGNLSARVQREGPAPPPSRNPAW